MQEGNYVLFYRKLVYMPVGLVKRFISISLTDSENIVDDNVFDCCIRSPEFGPISKLSQFIGLVINLEIIKFHEIDDLLFAARS